MPKHVNEGPNRRDHPLRGKSIQENNEFNNLPIHIRDLHDQLQDHDMTRLLPKSVGQIEVLAAVNCEDPRSEVAVNEGVVIALRNPTIQMICIPIGPGHWRSLYLTKPKKAGGKYDVEIFDPMGRSSAKSIEKFSTQLLSQAGIPRNKITYTHSEPMYLQKDVYACGDFVCAKTHQKIQELGAPAQTYSQRLINVLVQSGNHEDKLRHAIRLESAGLNPQNTANRPRIDDTKTPEKATAPRQRTTKKSRNTFFIYDNAATRDIIKQRDKIYSLAAKADLKLKSGEPLTDEDIAAQLQAKELDDAGYGSESPK